MSSALTKNERDGLDEVFLSIHSHTNKYQKIKEISSLIISTQENFNFKKLIKQFKYGIKRTKLSYLMLKYSKKKKNLSK